MSKYKNKKIEIDGLVFDSQAEARYYTYLSDLMQKGVVTAIIPQPRYLLQESFRKNGILFRKIEYVADFAVQYEDGRSEVVDVKGMETTDFKIKRKLFEKKYPELSLKVVKYVKKFGGWVTIEEYKKFKKEEKKVAK
ncbi:DUF1064 domain-containing protein [Priestia sp. FSL W8-0001]|uniref:DUF1064 domain-containing protein n=1 Tax=unclassified Priestia TaxID=2800374 RepID=UPI0030F826C6